MTIHINGGIGVAHLNMNNDDNRLANLRDVNESEAEDLVGEEVERSRAE